MRKCPLTGYHPSHHRQANVNLGPDTGDVTTFKRDEQNYQPVNWDIFDSFPAFSPAFTAPVFGIAPGEDIGIRDFEIPVGTTGQVRIGVGVGPATVVATGAQVPPVAVGPVPAPRERIIVRDDGTERVVLEHSVYDDWGPLDPEIYRTEDPTHTGPDPSLPHPVFIPPDIGGEDPYEPDPQRAQETDMAIDWGDLARGVINAIDPPTPTITPTDRKSVV